MDEARNAGLRGGLGNRLGAFQVDRVERLAAGRGEDAIKVLEGWVTGKRTLAWTAWIWPTLPIGWRWPARSGRRTAARTRQPERASALTVWRPTKPEPPKTVTS